MNNFKLPKVLEEMYATGYIMDGKNEKREAVSSTVSKAEAEMLMKAVTDIKARRTLETGVAFGASAIAICYVKKTHGLDGPHYGIDPNQSSFYADTTRHNLKKEGIENSFVLLEGPSHMMIPQLIEKNETVDFVFVDGWHTFDYTLIDFFLSDKILRPGGLIAFHDMHSLAKQKVLRFILTHRKYRVQKQYAVRGNESSITTLKFFLWRLSRKPRLLFSWFHWNYQLFNSSGLIILKKEESFEPNYDFYKVF